MNHLIRQQYLHVDFDGPETEAMSLQRRLRCFYCDFLLPSLEPILNRHCEAGRHICLERLELDLGTLPLERLELDLAASVAKALEKTLAELALLPDASGTEKTEQQVTTEAFLFFLEHGSLPWWFRLAPGQTLEQAVLASWDDSGSSSEAARLLTLQAEGLLQSEPARQRLLLQFSRQLISALLAELSPALEESTTAALILLDGMQAPSVALKQMKSLVVEEALTAAGWGETLSVSDLISRAWHRHPVSALDGSELRAALEVVLPNIAERKLQPRLTLDTQGTGKPGESPSPEPALAPTASHSGEHPEARGGIFVDDAGIVLLHPFLPQLFEALRVSNGESMLKPDRGVALLHYLAAGSSTTPEYCAMLPKVLCEMALQSPLRVEGTLSDEACGECDALLEAVVRHWGALGNCSADALRGTYLVRPGKLTLRDDGDWLLQVESSGCDILLDRLPWSISMVRLPWMDRVLWVEWAR